MISIIIIVTILLILISIIVILKYNVLEPVNENFSQIDVDVVVTWVDSTDPVWVNSYNYHTGKTFKDGIRWTPVSADPEAELSICLMLIRKNMPWVRNTYVLTSSRRPKCLINEILVHHSEIGLSPVFNSHAIESSMHLIPGLTENFIYFNDDFYVRLPVFKSAFINDIGIPILRYDSFSNKYRVYSKCPWINFIHKTSHIVGSNIYIIPSHTPYSLTISMMKNVKNNLPYQWEITKRCLVRYECSNEISPIIAAILFSIEDNTSIKAHSIYNKERYKFLHTPSKDTEFIKRFHFVCFNSLKGNRRELYNALHI
jgi:hypothetical protein